MLKSVRNYFRRLRRRRNVVEPIRQAPPTISAPISQQDVSEPTPPAEPVVVQPSRVGFRRPTVSLVLERNTRLQTTLKALSELDEILDRLRQADAGRSPANRTSVTGPAEKPGAEDTLSTIIYWGGTRFETLEEVNAQKEVLLARLGTLNQDFQRQLNVMFGPQGPDTEPSAERIDSEPKSILALEKERESKVAALEVWLVELSKLKDSMSGLESSPLNSTRGKMPSGAKLPMVPSKTKETSSLKSTSTKKQRKTNEAKKKKVDEFLKTVQHETNIELNTPQDVEDLQERVLDRINNLYVEYGSKIQSLRRTFSVSVD